MKNFIVLFIMALCLTMLTGGTIAQQKTKITKAEDLPRRSVQLNGKALEILNDEAQLSRLTDKLLANLKNDLDKFDIEDKASLKEYHSRLSQLYLFKNDSDNALKHMLLMSEFETKPSAKMTAGLFLETFIRHKYNWLTLKCKNF